MWKLVSHIKGRMYFEDVWEQGAKENVGTQEG
jgi:hypothetical protein